MFRTVVLRCFGGSDAAGHPPLRREGHSQPRVQRAPRAARRPAWGPPETPGERRSSLRVESQNFSRLSSRRREILAAGMNVFALQRCVAPRPPRGQIEEPLPRDLEKQIINHDNNSSGTFKELTKVVKPLLDGLP